MAVRITRLVAHHPDHGSVDGIDIGGELESLSHRGGVWPITAGHGLVDDNHRLCFRDVGLARKPALDERSVKCFKVSVGQDGYFEKNMFNSYSINSVMHRPTQWLLRGDDDFSSCTFPL